MLLVWDFTFRRNFNDFLKLYFMTFLFNSSLCLYINPIYGVIKNIKEYVESKHKGSRNLKVCSCNKYVLDYNVSEFGFFEYVQNVL